MKMADYSEFNNAIKIVPFVTIFLFFHGPIHFAALCQLSVRTYFSLINMLLQNEFLMQRKHNI